MTLRRVASLAIVLFAYGCGSRNGDDIPPALLDAITQSQQPATDYPEGPYGSSVGDIAPDVCVQGWLDPEAANHDVELSEQICLRDFWTPDAQSPRLLLVNTAAEWCTACKAEYSGSAARPSLAEEVQERYAAGLRILGTIFQKIDRSPVELSDGARWTKAFEVPFPFGVDSNFVTAGLGADASLQPFNCVLDTSTMEIVLQLEADEPHILWPTIDELLGE